MTAPARPLRDSLRSAGSERTVRLDFFGARIDVNGPDLPDFGFHFGPHVRTGSATDAPTFRASLTPIAAKSVGAPVLRELAVRRPDGVTVLRRSVRGWSNVPPPIPPFAVMSDRLVITQAVVLCKGASVLALIGSPQSAKATVGIGLANHGWRFVSGQLLVVERSSGHTLPYLAPLELRGSAVADLQRGLSPGTWRSTTSALTGEVLLVRPESLGAVVPVGCRVGAATMIRLCRSDDQQLRLRSEQFTPQAWPTAARGVLAGRRSLVLELPGAEASEEAADLLDCWSITNSGKQDRCPDGRAMPAESRAGSTPSHLT